MNQGSSQNPPELEPAHDEPRPSITVREATTGKNFAQSIYPFYLHPIVAFSSIWLIVCLLYSLHLSNLILYTGSDVLRLVASLVGMFLAGTLLSFCLPNRFVMPRAWRLAIRERTIEALDKRLSFWFRVWCCLTCIEIIYSGGIPSVWLITGNPKTYMDFGVPTIHGFMNSMLLGVCLTRFAMVIRFGRKKDLIYPLWAIFWSLIVITRQLMMVFLLEAVVIYCTYKVVQVKRILNAILGLCGLIYLFGVVGDMRTGAASFRALAQPAPTYPEWLPSGVLWFYMYLSTPVNNLLYTFHTTRPLDSWFFPNTLSQLLPTVLRKMAFSSDELNTVNGDLVTQAFNVSTAFAGPFQDYGLAGVLLTVLLMSVFSGLYWQKYTFRDRLCYAVLCQCLLLTVFYNHFVLLPVITQLIWLYVFFYRMEGDVFPLRITPASKQVHA